MKGQVTNLASLLEALGIDATGTSLLAIGLGEADVPGAAQLHVYESLSGPDDLPQDVRAQVGIVAAPLGFMSRPSAEQLLARLRDVHCEMVVLFDDGSGWSPDALRALGFLEEKRAPFDGHCYVYDPDVFNQPREWNNPSHWANPENFRKYRW